MKPTVFYDGGCPLCRREIQHYQNMRDAHAIRWIDITRSQTVLAEHKLSFEEAMKFIHGLDEDGELISGARVFILMWSQLGFYRYLGSTITRLKLVPVLDWFYRHFANWRFQRRLKSGCQLP